MGKVRLASLSRVAPAAQTHCILEHAVELLKVGYPIRIVKALLHAIPVTSGSIYARRSLRSLDAHVRSLLGCARAMGKGRDKERPSGKTFAPAGREREGTGYVNAAEVPRHRTAVEGVDFHYTIVDFGPGDRVDRVAGVWLNERAGLVDEGFALMGKLHQVEAYRAKDAYLFHHFLLTACRRAKLPERAAEVASVCAYIGWESTPTSTSHVSKCVKARSSALR